MNYLVEMRLAESGRSTTPADGLVFMEQYVLPTLQRCQRLETEGRIVAGGPVSGAIGLAFIIAASSAREIDDILEGLPMWPRMVTLVTPLTSWSDRVDSLGSRLERLRTGMMPADYAKARGGSQ
jgi:muconolactone delta-isomerase